MIIQYPPPLFVTQPYQGRRIFNLHYFKMLPKKKQIFWSIGFLEDFDIYLIYIFYLKI